MASEKKHLDEKYFIKALKNGSLVHVNEVKNGLACECICPSCETPVVAYNNPKNKNAHHFKHHSLNDCRDYYETMIHFMAKEIIAELGEITVPKHVFELDDYARSYRYYEWSRDNPKERVEQYTLKFDSVEVEKYTGGIKPDLLCVAGGKQIHIEVAVTHFVDEAKAEKIKRLGAVSLEIDLSAFDRGIQSEKLKEVLNGRIDLMKWHNNAAIEKSKSRAYTIKSEIEDFIRSNSKEKKAYGKAKKIYKCPLLDEEYQDDVSSSNCDNCRYLAVSEENFEGTPQQVYDDRRIIYSNIIVECIGHVSSQFDNLLVKYGIRVGRNKAFGK